VGNIKLTNSTLSGFGTDTLSGIEHAVLTAGWGNNVIDCSAFTGGAVTLTGGAGNDKLVGTSFNDVFTGGAGNHTSTGGSGSDRLIEQADANFTLTNTGLVGLGTDVLSGIDQAVLTGGAGNNRIICAAFTGSVTLKGGPGDDSLVGTSGNDV